jgi:hypothetical protein
VVGSASVPEWEEGIWNLRAGTPISERAGDGALDWLPCGMPANAVAGASDPTRLRSLTGSVSLPKRNYGHEKRQKELNKQRKREEKLQRKLDRTASQPEDADTTESPGPDRPAAE